MKLLDTLKVPSAPVHQLLGEINLDLQNMITAEDHLVAALDSYYKEELIVQRYDYYGTVTGEAIEVDHLNLASKSSQQRLNILRNPNVSTLDAIRTLGFVYFHRTDFQLAMLYFSKYKELISVVYGQGVLVSANAHVLNRLGNVTHAMGDLTKAYDYFMTSIETYYKIYGQDAIHEDIAHVLHNLGTLFNVTDIKKSLEFSERAIAMYQEVYQVSTHFCIARALSSITTYYQNSRTWREALRVGKKSLAMWNDVFGKESNNRFCWYCPCATGTDLQPFAAV